MRDHSSDSTKKDKPTANGAMNCGQGMPIFKNRPSPKESGNRNFWVPSERKTQPTRMRMSRMVLATRLAPVVSVFDRLVRVSFRIQERRLPGSPSNVVE